MFGSPQNHDALVGFFDFMLSFETSRRKIRSEFLFSNLARRPTRYCTNTMLASSFRPLLGSAAVHAPRAAVSPTMTTAVEIFQNPALDPIATAFEFVTLIPQPLWLLMILLPKWSGTRAIFQPITPYAYSLAYQT